MRSQTISSNHYCYRWDDDGCLTAYDVYIEVTSNTTEQPSLINDTGGNTIWKAQLITYLKLAMLYRSSFILMDHIASQQGACVNYMELNKY